MNEARGRRASSPPQTDFQGHPHAPVPVSVCTTSDSNPNRNRETFAYFLSSQSAQGPMVYDTLLIDRPNTNRPNKAHPIASRLSGTAITFRKGSSRMISLADSYI